MAEPLPDFRVRVSPRARRLRITITPHGEVVVTVPRRGRPAVEPLIEPFLRERAAWIARTLARVAAEASAPPLVDPIADGSVVAVLGRDHVVHVDVPRPGGSPPRRSSVRDGAGTLHVRLAPGDATRLQEVVERHLRARARAILRERADRRATVAGVRVGRVIVRDQRSRWGSASRRGTLSFNWRLILAPESVLDYVVAHEVAHLADFSHSAAFWARVAALHPGFREDRRWLRRHGRRLRVAGEA